MNHLHKFIDAGVTGVGTSIDGSLSEEEEAVHTSLVRDHVANAICFDAGYILDIVDNFEVIPELVRLPFPVCWIEFRTDVGFRALLCIDRKDYFDVVPILFKDGAWCGLLQFSMRTGESLEGRESITKFANGFPLACFLSAMNCSNVYSVEDRPSVALNKARVRRGKQPLFSTWTLSISIPKERRDSVALGGSHASPRVHLRRGHPREYKPGSWTWVQPCAVGAKENGMIHKDYKAICRTEAA